MSIEVLVIIDKTNKLTKQNHPNCLSTCEWIKKKILVHTCSGILLSKKTQNYKKQTKKNEQTNPVESERNLRQRLYDIVGFQLYDLLEKAELQRLNSERVSGCQWLRVREGTDFKRTWRNLAR